MALLLYVWDSLALKRDIDCSHDKHREHGSYGKPAFKSSIKAVTAAAGRSFIDRTSKSAYKILAEVRKGVSKQKEKATLVTVILIKSIPYMVCL